jgi:hypothetical protein
MPRMDTNSCLPIHGAVAEQGLHKLMLGEVVDNVEDWRKRRLERRPFLTRRADLPEPKALSSR